MTRRYDDLLLATGGFIHAHILRRTTPRMAHGKRHLSVVLPSVGRRLPGQHGHTTSGMSALRQDGREASMTRTYHVRLWLNDMLSRIAVRLLERRKA